MTLACISNYLMIANFAPKLDTALTKGDELLKSGNSLLSVDNYIGVYIIWIY